MQYPAPEERPRQLWLICTTSAKSAKAAKIPEQLDRTTVREAQAIRALGSSTAALHRLIHDSVKTDGRIRGFRPDVVGFVGYLIAHDAHHRGQIAMLASQLGYPVPQKAIFGMWEWGKR